CAGWAESLPEVQYRLSLRPSAQLQFAQRRRDKQSSKSDHLLAANVDLLRPRLLHFGQMHDQYAVLTLSFDTAGVDRFMDREGSVKIPFFVFLEHKILIWMARLDAHVQNQLAGLVTEVDIP